MLFRVDHASEVSLADQIATQVRISVAQGSLRSGERLPPARELARSLQINMHTVLRAYHALRDEGIVHMRQGRGAWISSAAQPGMVRLNELAHHLLAEAHKLGLTATDVTQLIDRLDGHTGKVSPA